MGWFVVYHNKNRVRRFLSHYRGLWLLLGAAGLSIALLLSPGSFRNNGVKDFLHDAVGFLGTIMTQPYHWVVEGATWGGTFFAHRNEVAQLKVRSHKLLALQRRYAALQLSYDSLQANLQYYPQTLAVQATADIFMGSGFAGSKIYWINLGIEDDVHRHQTVMAEGMLLGRLLDVSDHYSEILPVDHPLSRIPVFVGKQGQRALAAGKGQGAIHLEHVIDLSVLAEGDHVITSGDGGVFPKGIFVGTVYYGSEGLPQVRWNLNIGAVRYVQLLLHQPVLEAPRTDHAAS